MAGADPVQLGLWIVAALMILGLFAMRWLGGRREGERAPGTVADPVAEMEESLEERLAAHAPQPPAAARAPAAPLPVWPGASQPAASSQAVPITVLRRTLIELQRLDDPSPSTTDAPDDARTDRSDESLLPTRSPRVVAPTTAPARSLSDWRPAAPPVPTRGPAGPLAAPPPPTDAVDPMTGEPDAEAYRQWLRQWLDFVESQP
jgi:hypothetical protein